MVRIVDLWAADVEVERTLWRFALDLDLVEVLWIDQRPVDEPLRWMLADLRALEVRAQFDEQWVRLVDVPAALAARPMGAPRVAPPTPMSCSRCSTRSCARTRAATVGNAGVVRVGRAPI